MPNGKCFWTLTAWKYLSVFMILRVMATQFFRVWESDDTLFTCPTGTLLIGFIEAVYFLVVLP